MVGVFVDDMPNRGSLKQRYGSDAGAYRADAGSRNRSESTTIFDGGHGRSIHSICATDGLSDAHDGLWAWGVSLCRFPQGRHSIESYLLGNLLFIDTRNLAIPSITKPF